ncbi:MAG: hypothetical protein ACUVX8_08680 [Candidatus Zipacnadales bacterium]
MTDTPPPMAKAEVEEQREGLAHVLRSTLEQTYDYIFLVIGASLLWSTALAVPLLPLELLGDMRFVVPTGYLLAALTVGPMTVAIYALAEAMSSRELPALGILVSALPRFYLRAVALFVVQTVLGGGIALATWFYQARFDHWLLKGLSLLWLYVGLFWAVVALYTPALLVREGGSIWSALRNAVVLTLAHPGYSFLILLQVLFLLLLVALPLVAGLSSAVGLSFVLVFLFLPAFVPLLTTNAITDLLRKHMPEASEEEAGDPRTNRTPVAGKRDLPS